MVWIDEKSYQTCIVGSMTCRAKKLTLSNIMPKSIELVFFITMIRYHNAGLRRYAEKPVFPYARGVVEFQAILSGTARPERPGLPSPLESGPRLWVLGPESVHGWTDQPGGESEIVVLHVYDPNPVLLRALGPEQLLTCPLGKSGIRTLRELYHGMAAQVRTGHGMASLWMDKVKAELSLLILTSVPRDRLREGSLHAQTKVNQAISWFREHLSQAATVARVAQGLGVSTVHLRRLFHEVHGRSPHEVFHDIRMTTALQWIEEGSLRASEISDRLGFSEPSAFTRAFRQWHGSPPSKM
jgi:AraC-like DNA-binding protein